MPAERISTVTVSATDTPLCVRDCGRLTLVEGEADLPEGHVEWLRCDDCDQLHRVQYQSEHPGQGQLL
jgi:hypothetical protein